MFSKKLKEKLMKLGINPAKPPSVIRQELENTLDEKAEFKNTDKRHRYLKIESVYSNFMEEYNDILDSSNILFK